MEAPDPAVPAAALALLRRAQPFAALPAEVLAELAARAERLTLPAGKAVIRQGGAASRFLYVIESGAVRLEVGDADGTEAERQLVAVCEEGDFIGATSLLDRAAGARARYTALVVTDTVAYRLPREAVLALAERHASLTEALSERSLRLHRLADAELDAHTQSRTITQRLGLGIQTLVAPIDSLVRRAPVVCPPTARIRDAALRMNEAGVGSILVVDDAMRPLGIVTDTDLRRKVVAEGRSSDEAVERIMSSPVLAVAGSAPAIDALQRMAEHGMRHLAVVDEAGRTTGVISAGGLLLAQGQSPAAVLRTLETAIDLDDLAAARTRLGPLLEEITRVGIDPEIATRTITALNDRAVRRALAWAEDDTVREVIEERGATFRPPRYCWLALGSEGRREQTLATDQDNAIVHDADPDDAAAADWLERFARRAIAHLERIGFPRCPGEVMASNARWRRSLAEWEAQVALWMDEPSEQALLQSTIFFDFRPVHGDLSLGQALWARILGRRRNDIFLAHLSRAATSVRPPLGVFRTFAVRMSGSLHGTFDLKERALAPLVDCARVLALANGVAETNTFERFARAADAQAISRSLAEDAREAYGFLMLARLQHHLEQRKKGIKPDNHLNPKELSSFQRRGLKAALEVVGQVQSAVGERFGGAMLG
jgi:CBS domain-containing protein